MKHIKTYENNETTDSEIKELFKQLKYHDEKHREIDNKLAKICMSKIEPLINSNLSDFEIKNIYYNFYKDLYGDPEDRSQTVNFSFEKDLVMMWINKQLKKREEQNKYNL
jgi:hypothetical protein